MDMQSNFIWVELNTVNISWQGRPATLNFLRDVTFSKNLERQFQEAQRIESIGTLAGGIAHDFNNLLMGIQGNVSLIHLDAGDNSGIREKLHNIEDCIESASRLTKQLLGFARGGQYVVRPISMNRILQKSAEMFGRTRKAIKIHGSYDKQLWTVIGDSNQIEQVLLNLFLNAWQAMDKTGDLFLRTDNVELSSSFVKPYDVAPGRYVCITVRDTGLGMDESTRRRIFEPFFTTQLPGRGTGLGLASVFGIIKNHRGIITVDSRLGEGTTFHIYLPASDKTPDIEPIPVETIAEGTETILLVDDEDYIIEVGRLMLEGLGYTVLTAANGNRAIDLFLKNQTTIDLVILDMVMPELDGEAVFNRIQTIRPDIKVMFASGHSFSKRQHLLLQKGTSDFLQKPFNLKQLSTRIRSILDS